VDVFRQISLGAVLFCSWLAIAPLAAAQPRHPVKCAVPPDVWNPKAKVPQQFALPHGFRDSLLSPSQRFMIFYDAAASDTDSIASPQYVHRAAEEADSAYAFEIETLGYTAPAFTENGHYNIYLAPLHSGLEAYGATYILEGGQLVNSPSGNERWRSYNVIDNTFTSPIYATHGFDAERITIFHEFFHMVQFSGYGHPPTGIPNYIYFQEMSSVWMEWLSTPNVRDYLNYVASYLSTLDTRFDLTPSSGYGQYVYFAYLTHRFDTAIVQKIWEYYRDSSTDPANCIDEVLRRDYGTSFCQEYERFGAELMQTGRRYQGTSLLPDAQILPADTIPIQTLGLDSTGWFVTTALSLQFADAGSGSDTCIEVLARDTDRSLESNVSITFTAIGTPPTIAMDRPEAYCDTEVCIYPLSATAPGLESFPSPFLPDGTSELYMVASTNANPPISVVMNVLDLNENEIRSTKLPAVPFRGTWNAVWDGRDDNGKLVPSGEYLYSLRVDGALRVGKIVVVRK